MPLNADDYRDAALDHLDHTRRAYDRKDYMVAHYYSGVAVECILRAYLIKGFYSRHDLGILASDGFLSIIDDDQRREWEAKINEVNLRWRSNHRYYSAKSLKRYLKDAELDRKVRGDILKENSRVLRELALEIVGYGEMRWKSKKK